MADDKRDRRDSQQMMGAFDRQKFEQEVAEEIGVSLDRALGRASRRSKNAVSSPGAQQSPAGEQGNDLEKH